MKISSFCGSLALFAFATLARAQSFQLLHSFNSRPEYPVGVICKGSDGNYYGVSQNGGASEQGTVFRVTPSGTVTVIHSFTSAEGVGLNTGLVEGPDGFFYGTAPANGSPNGGSFFKVNPNGVYVPLVGNSGMPFSGLRSAMIVGNDGNLYGVGAGDGSISFGGIYKLTPSGQISVFYTFTGPTGKSPAGRLLLAPDGNFYGATSAGGTGAHGTIFKITPAGSLTVLTNVPGGSSAPSSGLTLAGDGNFYGLAGNSIYRVKPSGDFAQFYTFTTATGSNPTGELVVGSDGNLYGATIRGGANGKGAVYQISLAGVYTKLGDFNTATYGSDFASIIETSTPGTFIGMSKGQTQSIGAVFTITPPGGVNVLTTFNISDGITPSGPLTEGNDGTLYSTTTFYNTSDGTVYRIGQDGSNYTTLLKTSYNDSIGWISGGVARGNDGFLYGTSDGKAGFGSGGDIYKVPQAGGPPILLKDLPQGGPPGYPQGYLVLGSDGAFYGTCLHADYDSGGIFRVTTDGTVTMIQTFNGSIGNNGGNPWPKLVIGGDGNIYGATQEGGANANGPGFVFRITPGPTPVYTALLTVPGTGNATPNGDLLAAADGNIYGTTYGGMLFKITQVGVVSTLGNSRTATGTAPVGPIAIATDGNFYGATSDGGANSVGCIYRMTPAGAVNVIYNFPADGPNAPTGGLILGTDGRLYGTSSGGPGISAQGSVFSITTSGVFHQIVQFDFSTGYQPLNSLYRASSGVIYGLNTVGGTGGGGTLFSIGGAPIVTTGSAITIAATTATLMGSVNANLGSTSTSFDYGTDPNNYASNKATLPATVNGAATTSVNAQISGLLPHTLYHYRLKGVSGGGTTYGNDLFFTTTDRAPAAPGKTIQFDAATPTASIDLATLASDPDGDTLSYSITGTSGGTVQLTGSVATFTLSDPTLPTNFSYRVSDGFGGTATGTITVHDGTAPVIKILGNNPAFAEAGIAYSDAGATASDTVAGDVTGVIQVVNHVNVNAVGDYTVNYTVADPSHNSASAARTVHVRDTTPPVIALLGTNPVLVEAGTAYVEAGATASDTFAGNLTSAIQTAGNINAGVVGDYTVTYTVSDGYNTTMATRVVQVRDTTPPVIIILGSNPITVEAGPAYADAGATASDSAAGNLTAAIHASSNVNSRVPGDYAVTYSVTDGYNPVTAVRTVHVVDTTGPTITHIPSARTVIGDVTNHAPVPDFTGDLTASDNVSVTNVTQDPSPGTIVGFGDHTITFTVSDAAQNSSTAQTTFTVADGPALPGRYAGLLTDEEGAIHALMELKLTRGRFLTGYLRLDNRQRVWFPGTVLPAATHAETLTLNDGSSLALTFDGYGHVTATRTAGEQVFTVNGILADPGAPAGVPGTYTAVIEFSQNNERLAHQGLAGSEGTAPGWIYAVVSGHGSMRLSGRLPDGSTISSGQGSIVDRHGQALFFVLGKGASNPLLAGPVQFENLPTSDFDGALTFNGLPYDVSGARFTPASSGLPAGVYPLTLSGAGLDLASTVTLNPDNTAAVLAPITAFYPRSKPGQPATGIFYLTFRNPAIPTGPVLKGSGVFQQKLGTGAGQFSANGATGRVQLGTAAGL